MRPKKVILLLGDNEMRRRVWRYVFEVRGPYVVLSGKRLPRHPGARLTELLCRADVAVIDVADNGKRVCREVTEQLRGIRVVQVGGAIEESLAQTCLRRRAPHQDPMAELLEAVRVHARRKRGPKKGWRAGAMPRRAARSWSTVTAMREWMAA